MVDVVGHIPLLVILVATLLQGETRLQQVSRGPASGPWASARVVLIRYIAILTVLMSLYYGLHAVLV